MTEENLETLRKKLIFRSWHRGTREMDLIMGRFATAHVPHFNADELRQYETLLTENDPDIYDWLLGRLPVPEHCNHVVMKTLQQFHAGK